MAQRPKLPKPPQVVGAAIDRSPGKDGAPAPQDEVRWGAGVLVKGGGYKAVQKALPAHEAVGPAAVGMPRLEWALAFNRRVDELRPRMGRRYMATIVATLWPKHRNDDPEQVAVQWVAAREV